MNTFIFYLLKVILCSGVLYLYYFIALRNKLFHQWNRFFLLSGVVLSLIIPFFQFTVYQQAEAETTRAIQVVNVVQSANDYIEEMTAGKTVSFSWEQGLMVLYYVISAIFLLLLLQSLSKICLLIVTHPGRKVEKITFISSNAKGTPFSFFNFIFWNEAIDLQSETGKHIFMHELIHVRDRHTFDKLFMQLVISLFWCNPFFWLIRKELKMIHEFVADQKSISVYGTAAFAAMILQSVYPGQFNSLTNHFSQSIIKRRLQMLTKIQNPGFRYASRIVALPMIVLTVLAFTIKIKKISSPVRLPAESVMVVMDSGPAMNRFSPEKKKDLRWNFDREQKIKSTIDGKSTAGKNEILFTNTNESSNEKSDPMTKKGTIIFENVAISDAIPEKYWLEPDTIPLEKLMSPKNYKEACVNSKEWRKFLGIELQPIIEEIRGQSNEWKYEVKLKFRVEIDGSINDLVLVSDPGHGIGVKVLEIMKNSPHWQPARAADGTAIVSYHTETIDLIMSNSSKDINKGVPAKYIPLHFPGENKGLREITESELQEIVGLYTKTGKVISFMVCTNDDSDGSLKFYNTGAEFSEKVKAGLRHAEIGDLVTIENILLEDNGKTIRVPAIAYSIIK